jgi:hypothetical protein
VLCEAPDLELLLVEWLNAVIYEMGVRKMLFGRFAVRIEDGRLEGTLWGELGNLTPETAPQRTTAVLSRQFFEPMAHADPARVPPRPHGEKGEILGQHMAGFQVGTPRIWPATAD